MARDRLQTGIGLSGVYVHRAARAMNRRGFLAGILAAGFAPAAIGSGILMPTRPLMPWMGVHKDSKLWMPVNTTTWADSMFTATGAIGPFRHVLLYDSVTGKALAEYDYGAQLSLSATETFTVDLLSSPIPPAGPDVRFYDSRRVW